MRLFPGAFAWIVVLVKYIHVFDICAVIDNIVQFVIHMLDNVWQCIATFYNLVVSFSAHFNKHQQRSNVGRHHVVHVVMGITAIVAMCVIILALVFKGAKFIGWPFDRLFFGLVMNFRHVQFFLKVLRDGMNIIHQLDQHWLIDGFIGVEVFLNVCNNYCLVF